jgi:hypothetical protein
MELRLQRRERELMTAVEEAKGAARVEMGRLSSVHKQELREKDEQLLRFRGELEALVSELRKQASAMGTTTIM